MSEGLPPGTPEEAALLKEVCWALSAALDFLPGETLPLPLWGYAESALAFKY